MHAVSAEDDVKSEYRKCVLCDIISYYKKPIIKSTVQLKKNRFFYKAIF